MKRWGLAVVAVMAASCASSTNVAETVEPDANDARLGTVHASRATSRDAALDVRTTGCGPREGFGSASLIDDGLAITAAHVVAGADEITVIDPDLNEHDASVVAFDPDLDIALLRIPDGIGTPMELLDTRVEAGDVGAITAVRDRDDAEVAVTLDVEVLRRANVATTDIAREREVVRPGFEIAGDIEPGDSGAVVVIDGQGAGVVWSRSVERDGRAWVVNIPDLFRDLDDLRQRIEPVDTGECT